jgi:neutral trehalase
MSEMESQHDEVIRGIARLESGQEHIMAHLAKLNGSVGKLWDEVNATKRDVLKHALDCPWKKALEELNDQLLKGEHPGSVEVNRRVAALEVKVATSERAITDEEKVEAARREAIVIANCTRREWMEWIRPLVMAAIVVIAVLALEHARVILPAVK